MFCFGKKSGWQDLGDLVQIEILNHTQMKLEHKYIGMTMAEWRYVATQEITCQTKMVTLHLWIDKRMTGYLLNCYSVHGCRMLIELSMNLQMHGYMLI